MVNERATTYTHVGTVKAFLVFPCCMSFLQTARQRVILPVSVARLLHGNEGEQFFFEKEAFRFFHQPFSPTNCVSLFERLR